MHSYSDGARHTYPNMYLIRPRYVRNGDDVIGFTLGLNWKPTRWFTLRPEVRYDAWDNADCFNGKSGNWKNNQWSGGVSGVVKF